MRLPFVFAKRFVAGETFDQAITKVREINNEGVSVTLDLLGENVGDRERAGQTVDEYIELLRSIEREGLESTISIKLSMIGLDIDREYCRTNLFKLLDVAREEDQFVRIDMEGSDYTADTIDLFKEAFEQYGNHVGIVIQAYLHRSKRDIEELAEMGADVRICKGAYKEPPEIAIQSMADIREAYKEYTKVLLDKAPFPRIATHDDALINWVKSYTREHRISRERFEFQMLYGLRQETVEEMAGIGYHTRIYIPYGTMWFPYFKRRLMERKENIWFVLSTMFKK